MEILICSDYFLCDIIKGKERSDEISGRRERVSYYFTISQTKDGGLRIHKSVTVGSLYTLHGRVKDPILCTWYDPSSIEDVKDIENQMQGRKLGNRHFEICNEDIYFFYKKWRRSYSMQYTCSEVFNIEGSPLGNKVMLSKAQLPWDIRIGYLLTIDQRILRLLKVKLETPSI